MRLPIAIPPKVNYIEPMNTDEPTEKLKDAADYETKPIMELILERVNAIGAELAAFRQETNVRLETLENELRNFKEETAENFRKVQDGLDILASDVISVRADSKRHERRLKNIEELERKAS